MSIKMGNGNKINNSSIGHNSTNITPTPKKDFFSRHPIFTVLIVPFIIGFILLFDFFDELATWITNLFS